MIGISNFFGLFSHDIGIDLGTANVLVFVKGQGVVINEPSVVAVNQNTGAVVAIGEEARQMVGRTPSHIVATRPLVDGVISDFETTEQMLKYFIDKVHETSFSLFPSPRVIIGIPSGVTEVEKKAVEDAAKNAGARQVYLIEEPMAAAIGSNLPIQDAKGNMIVDIGGGTSEISVISLGGTVISKSLRLGDALNNDIIQYIKNNYNLLLGQRTAEEIKIKIGSALPTKEKVTTIARGRDMITGLPKEISVNNHIIYNGIQKTIHQICLEIQRTIEDTPPELVADIIMNGITLAGGGALLHGLDDLISQYTKVPVHVAEDPLTCVVRGTGIALDNLDSLKEVLISTEVSFKIRKN